MESHHAPLENVPASQLPLPLPSSLTHRLTAAFPDTPSHVVDFSLLYYRDEIDLDSQEHLPWISKKLPLGVPPLPVLARHAFEAPASSWLSSKCDTVYLQYLIRLQSDPTAMLTILDEIKRYEPPNEIHHADGLPDLCAAVFEAYVETCDARDVCVKLREILSGGTGMSEEQEEGLRHALEDHELMVSARAARLQIWIGLLAPVAGALHAVDSSTLSGWSFGWYNVLNELQMRVGLYMTTEHAMVLVPAMCTSCLQSLEGLLPRSDGALSIQTSNELVACVGRVKDRMASILPEQYHASMASMHGVHHILKAILGIMRSKSRLEIFHRLSDCIPNLDTVVEESEAIFRAHADFFRTTRLLDPVNVDAVANHLHDTDVRLHDAEIHGTSLVEAHVGSLASFKRGVYVSSLVGNSESMTAGLVRRGIANLQGQRRKRRGYMRRIKGMSAPSATLVRNRHQASLATHLISVHRNEETEKSASAVLAEVGEENARLVAAIDSASAMAMDTPMYSILRQTSSSGVNLELLPLEPTATALSELWTSRNDTSLHWVMIRLRRLEAAVLISNNHLDILEGELPAAADAFRNELAALSTVVMSSTISSACLDEYLTKYHAVVGRIANLVTVLGRNADRVDALCVNVSDDLKSFDISSLGGLKTTTAFRISLGDACAALSEHVRLVVAKVRSERDKIIDDIMAELVDVGSDAYRSRQEAKMVHTLCSGINSVVRSFADGLLSSDANAFAAANKCFEQHGSASDLVDLAVVLHVPTFSEAAQAARQELLEMAVKIEQLVSDAFHGVAPLNLPPVQDLRDFFVQMGDSCVVQVSRWLVVEVGEVIRAEVDSKAGNLPVEAAATSRLQGFYSRIESIVEESAILKDTIRGHLRSTKEELRHCITTIVSDMRERAWLLEAAANRLRYDCDVYNFAHGDQGVLVDYSSLPTNGSHDELIKSLRSKVLKAERALLVEFQDIQARAMELGEEMAWVNDIATYSTIELEIKLGELGVTLGNCVDQAIVGARDHSHKYPLIDPWCDSNTSKCALTPYELHRMYHSLARRLCDLSALFGDSTQALHPIASLDQTFSTLRELNNQFESFSEGIDRFKAASWEDCRRDIADGLRMAFEHQNHIQGLSKVAGSWIIFQEYKNHVSLSTEVLELVSAICTAPLQDRHWDKLSGLCRSSASELNIKSYHDGGSMRCSPADVWAVASRETTEASAASASDKADIEDLLALALREGKLMMTFEDIKGQWMTAEIELGTYKSKGAIFLEPSVTADVMDGLADAIMTLTSMASNRASQHFREDIKDFIKILSSIEESMQLWLSTQSVWSYLEAVFDGGDIAAQLPEEAAKFADINARYLSIAREAICVPRYVEFFRGDDKREAFVLLLGELEMCQKSLSAYLESKRKVFPRFYFVSDSTLLEILSHGSNPRAVQRQFQAGLFDGIDRLTFEGESNLATGLVSKEGESVKLLTPVVATGPAEMWLEKLVESMRETMRHEARRASKEIHRLPIEDFLFTRPAQMALLGLQLKWTADVQCALYQASLGKKGTLKRLSNEYETTLSKLVELTLSSDLSPVQRTSLETCITIFIHQKDVIEELIEKRVGDPRSFEWLKHCRFRWRDDKGSLFVSICDNEFEYGYEYLGVKERLVMTPLTDVCYVALTQAVGMNCGGAPAGPAGTGKTETTKDLGATLGRYVVVFNCSDQMDHHMMGRIFKGLAQAGFWGCFDEFNRINLDVLSVCAQQLNCVFTALKQRKRHVIFSDGDSIPLNPEVGYFITMNPGYAGRQELPENLKALFRGVTMMAPDRRIIMKVKLAAAGFQESDVISRKFDRLYTLCEQQLSKQPHYDFGLRNILSVLRTAGAAKRANPTTREIVLMMNTLYDMNVSKFVSQDVQTFAALMHDVFPKVEDAPPQAPEFGEALKETCEEVGWSYHAEWVEKCLQLYETSLVRHGIMVVGPSRSGKSTAIDAVARTLTRLGSKTSVWRMNPKSITAPQMFGKLDQTTGDWTDGIFSQLWKKAARTSHSIWIVVDGPVDAVWIENLNTVLDDNKVLTLANGDRVRMRPNMRLVFEAENLNNASPATVSRAGVVFMSSSVLGWRPIVDSYLKSNEYPAIQHWLYELVEACLAALSSTSAAAAAVAFAQSSLPVNFSDSSRSLPIPLERSEVAMVESVFAYLEGLLARHPQFAASMRQGCRSRDASDTLGSHVRHALIFCAVWGIAGALPRVSRVLFSARLKERFGDLLAFVPDQGSIHDFMFDVYADTWIPWIEISETENFAAGQSSGAAVADRTQAQTSPPAVDFSSITVKTPEETRCRYLMDLLLSARQIPHLVGPKGTGKTTIAKHYCEQRRADGIDSRTFAFSALKTPQMLYDSLDSCLEKRQGCSYGPVGGGSMIFVFDDVSMPQRNEWGDQVTNELLRQLFELDGFYRLSKPIGEFTSVGDVSYVVTSKVGGDLGIPNRLSGILQAIYVDQPNEAEVARIVYRMIHAFSATRCLTENAASLVHRLGNLAIKICSTLARTLHASSGRPHSSDRFHYNFGMQMPCTIIRSALSKLCILDQTDGEEVLLRLFAHECRRELVDRLVTETDIQSATATINSHFADAFGTSPEPSFFSSFIDVMGASSDKSGPSTAQGYTETFAAGAQLVSQVESAIKKSRQKLGPIVLFEDALHHVLKVTRVLESERRSIMLVGVGGSGKKSLARVAAAVAGVAFVHSAKGPNYGVSNFLDELGAGLKRSGVKGESVCFMISDADVCDSVLLDFVNQQLITGRIPDLFQKEDVDCIVAELRPAFKENHPGAVDAEDVVLDFFWDRVGRYFHFCFCFSPTDGVVSRWSQQFPGLLSACTIDWFHPWPKDALISLAIRLLPELGANVAELVSQIHMMTMQMSSEYFDETGRLVHITPKSYLSFVGSVSALHSTKLLELRRTRDSLILGLEKMADAKDQVDSMKVELEEKQVMLARSKGEIAALIAEIDGNTEEAIIERRKVQSIVSRVTKKAKEILQTKIEAERDLEAAKPALDAALEALNSITPKDINSLKALRNPPDVIKRIMDCVLILRHMRVGKVSWHEVKGIVVLEASYPEALRMMNEMGFLQTLLSFPKEEINDETVELLQPYFRAGDFNYDSAKKASGNVAGLCNWAEAMCKYHVVAREVEPKIIRLQQSEKELNVAKKEQETAEEDKDKVEAALRALEERLEEANGEMSRVQRDADTTEMKLHNAITLIESLGGEGARWEELKQEIDDKERKLLGDCLLACTFTSYLGPIGVTHRDKYLQSTKQLCKKLGVEISDSFDPVGFLADGADVLKWLEASLPADEFSVQNGALFSSSLQSVRPPYVIDPQGQCIQWILRMYPDAVSVPISSASVMDAIESAIVRGVPIILQGVDENFGTSLDFILERPVSPDGTVDRYVRIGEREVEAAPGFQVVLTTRLANPSISPENFAKCTVIDFAVTGDGLEEQFLAFLISRDEAELDRKRQHLDEDVRRCESKIKQLENDLLMRLSSHQGDILEDTHLINVLADTKETTKQVAIQLQEASVTKQTIASTCEKYRHCARIASLLYFALCDFAKLNHMYETSLEQFLAWVDESINTAPKASTTAGRAANVLSELKMTVYLRAQYGMFERDKDAWRLLMAVVCSDATRRNKTENHSASDADILRLLVTVGDNPSQYKRKPSQWLSDEQWTNLVYLQQSGLFDNLLGGPLGLTGGSESKWKAWVSTEEPEFASSPVTAPCVMPGVKATNAAKGARGADGLTSTSGSQTVATFPEPTLHQLALIRALRPDRSISAIRLYVEGALGPDFLASKAAELSKLVHLSKPDEPIICVISPGADPTSSIHELARRFKTKCHDVSMGQGQETVARECLALAKRQGDWVCIQNAHLAGSFLKELADDMHNPRENDAMNIKSDHGPNEEGQEPICGVNPNFRLWITTEPTEEFPLALLHRGTRVTCEPPSGVHDALMATVSSLSDDTFEEVKTPLWKPLLLSLVCMHVLSQERKRFGAIGWVIGYEFSVMDLHSSLNILSNHLFSCQRNAKAPSNGDHTAVDTAAVDWEALRYLISVIQYGGRIIDDRDQRLMDVLVKRFVSPEHCNGGAIPLLDAKRFSKIQHLYRLRVDDNSTRDSLIAEVEAFPIKDIPEIFGLDGSAELIALELAGRALFASLATVLSCRGASEAQDKYKFAVDECDTNHGSETHTVRDTEDAAVDLRAVSSEPLRAVFRMELSQRLDPSQRALLSSAMSFKGRCMHLGSLSNPRALLNAVLQDFARKHCSLTIDELEIEWKVTKLNAMAVREPPKEGVYFWGIVLEGGVVWDDQRGALRLCAGTAPAAPMNSSGSPAGPSRGFRSPFPVMHITAIEKGKRKRSSGKRKYACPLFADKGRKAAAFVEFVDLAIDGGLASEDFVQRGVAMIVE